MDKAFWNYYKDINSYTILVSLVFGVIFGILWGFIIFSTFGIFIGLLFFRNFKNSEYYLYHNLGYTKTNLIKKVGLVNLSISTAFLLVFIALR